MQRELPLEFASLCPPGIGWAPAADGSWPICCKRTATGVSALCVLGRALLHLCLLELLRAECSELAGETPQARTLEQLLDICIRLAAEGTLDSAIESGTVAAYRTARQP